MTGLGIPVPAGFTVTTEACVAYMAAGKEFPAGMVDEIDAHLAQLEEQTGKRFGAFLDRRLQDLADMLKSAVRQELDRQDHGRQRRAERGRHACCSPSCEQDLAFRR